MKTHAMKPLQVGLLGIGTVGLGTWKVLRRNEEEIARRAGRPIRITWIAERALDRARELTEGSAVSTPDVTLRLERDERARSVRDAVARLPEKQRTTLVLKIYHEMTHEQIAELLGTSVGTAKANLFHALAGLRRMLGQSGGTP